MRTILQLAFLVALIASAITACDMPNPKAASLADEVGQSRVIYQAAK